MKICDLVQWYGAEGSGGIRTYVDRKSAHLAARGGIEHVVIRPGPETRRTRESSRTVYQISGRQFVENSPYRWFGRPALVDAILKREAPDIIEFDSPYHLPWHALRQRARRSCAVVGFYHADVPVAYGEAVVQRLGAPWLQAPARRLLQSYVRSVHSRCDATVATTPSMIARLESMKIPRTAIAPLGVDADFFRPDRRDEAVRARLGCGPDDLLLVYAGRFVKEKRIDVLADAVELLPPALRANLVLIGGGPLAEEMRRRSVVSDRLRVAPFVRDRDELAAILASADLYVTAGPHETYGLSVVEAMACGTPVVGVDAGALPDRIVPGTGGLAPSGDPAAFAARIEEVVAAGVVAAGVQARRHVAACGSWDETFRRLLEIYDHAWRRRRRLESGRRRRRRGLRGLRDRIMSRADA